ncbi:hypothetical protein EDD86DRAFT_204588 [Gorgonomyces haynaldii]|nr:hypothetical protein EDD86DRAFT_204588 [Gorgonomyces haynaldii]
MIALTDLPLSQKAQIECLEHLSMEIIRLNVAMDSVLSEAFQHLCSLIGTKSFLPAFAALENYVLTVKWARRGLFDLGYVIPWTHVYGVIPYIGNGSKMGQIAAQALMNSGHRDMVHKYHLTAATVNPQLLGETHCSLNQYGEDAFPALFDSQEVSKLGLKKERSVEKYKKRVQQITDPFSLSSLKFKKQKPEKKKDFKKVLGLDLELAFDPVKLPHVPPAAVGAFSA